LFFDIDGVITRGRTLLPHSRSAFRLLTDDNGHFLVPSIFVTNSGNALRKTKAQQLSDWLGVQVFQLVIYLRCNNVSIAVMLMLHLCRRLFYSHSTSTSTMQGERHQLSL